MSDQAPRLPLRFSRRQRIRSTRRFSQIYALRSSVADSALILYAAPNQLDYPRLGLSVSKRHGNAVRRNRLRRVLREAFRLVQHQIPPGFDYILIPRPAFKDNLTDCRESLISLTAQAARKTAQSTLSEDQ